MSKRKKEIRVLKTAELRIKRDGDELPKIEGYAAVFNKDSEDSKSAVYNLLERAEDKLLLFPMIIVVVLSRFSILLSNHLIHDFI